MTVKTFAPFRIAWIQAFGIISQEGSASAAARKLGCDQSTISRSIKDLSNFVGGDLFEGGTAGKLTPLGEALLPKAGEMMDLLRQISDLNFEITASDKGPSVKKSRKIKRSLLSNWFS